MCAQSAKNDNQETQKSTSGSKVVFQSGCLVKMTEIHPKPGSQQLQLFKHHWYPVRNIWNMNFFPTPEGHGVSFTSWLIMARKWVITPVIYMGFL